MWTLNIASPFTTDGHLITSCYSIYISLNYCCPLTGHVTHFAMYPFPAPEAADDVFGIQGSLPQGARAAGKRYE